MLRLTVRGSGWLNVRKKTIKQGKRAPDFIFVDTVDHQI
jgi:hypothetical protein